MTYLDGNRLHFYGSGGDSYLYYGGPGIDRLRLVEDEVADAVVDGFAAILFDGLKRMGMVTNHAVGTGINNAVCLFLLVKCWV